MGTLVAVENCVNSVEQENAKFAFVNLLHCILTKSGRFLFFYFGYEEVGQPEMLRFGTDQT